MKKIVFLFVGVILVVVILSLQSFGGISANMKRLFFQVNHIVENTIVEIYLYIKSFVAAI